MGSESLFCQDPLWWDCGGVRSDPCPIAERPYHLPAGPFRLQDRLTSRSDRPFIPQEAPSLLHPGLSRRQAARTRPQEVRLPLPDPRTNPQTPSSRGGGVGG